MLSYTEAWMQRGPAANVGEPSVKDRMVETRIKPYREQVAAEERREEQRRRFTRNQVFGLLMLAAAILVGWLFHTNPRWIFPPGWWRP
jgi:hypothetical protein